MKRPDAVQKKVVALTYTAFTFMLTGMAVLSLSAQTSKPNVAGKSAAAAATIATSQSKEWPDYAGGPEGNRYMDFKQITKANVDKLEVAWTYPYAETGNNAIVADGVDLHPCAQ